MTALKNNSAHVQKKIVEQKEINQKKSKIWKSVGIKVLHKSLDHSVARFNSIRHTRLVTELRESEIQQGSK